MILDQLSEYNKDSSDNELDDVAAEESSALGQFFFYWPKNKKQIDDRYGVPYWTLLRTFLISA